MLEQMRWSPTIGDPSLMGWITVCLYLLCSVCAFVLYKNSESYFTQNFKKQKVFWLIMFVAMLFLGINKQLDLQTFMTELGRYLSKQQGWYQNRHSIQRKFIYAVILLGGLSMAGLVVYFRSIISKNLLAIIGIGVVVVFVLIRASSFHHMDVFINTRMLGLKMNWILEIGGISFILLNQYRLMFFRR